MPAKKSETPARSPHEIFAERVREIREGRRWTQQDLADRLRELGAPVDRATVARTENGTRGISLDDAVLYAAALGAQFTYMVVGIKGEPIALAPALRVSDNTARRWIRGHQSLRKEDDRTYLNEVSEDEWLRHQRVGIDHLLDRVQGLVDAAIADDKEAMAMAIDDVNAELERQEAALKQRPGKRG